MPRKMTTEIDPTKIQGRIKRVFLDTKLTQETFAELVNVGQSHLSGIMLNRRPSLRILQSIALFTGANLKWLETGLGSPYGKKEPLEEHPELARVIKESVKVWGLSLDEFPEYERYEMAAQMLKIVDNKRKSIEKPKTPVAATRAPKQEAKPTPAIEKPVEPKTKTPPVKKPAVKKGK